MSLAPPITCDADVAEGAAWLAEREPRFAMALAQTGPLPLRLRPPGFAGLLDIIVGQQVSVASARAIYTRLVAAGLDRPENVLRAGDDVHKIKHKISILGLTKSYDVAVDYENNLIENSTEGKVEFEAILQNMTSFLETL